jgi:hypothetical protein
MYNDELTKKLAETAKRIMAGESVEAIEEATGDKEAYQKFFNDTLKKYGVKSPSELKGDDKKKFFDEIDAGWKGDDEKPEKNESVELEEAAKISGKDAYKWLTSNKVFDDEDFTNPPSFDDAVKSYRGSGPGLDAFINLAKKHGGKKSTDGWGWIGGARNFYDKVLVPAAKGYASVEESVEELEESTEDLGEGKKKPKLTDKQIINHPDANVVLTISHDGVEKAVADLRKGDYDDDFYIAVDSGHKKYSKIYVLDVQDISESTEELEEAKIDLNKKFNTSDAAFDYFHSFAVADQAKTDQEVEKSKKKFAKNTLGFWMQNLTDTLKGMGISEETELDLTEEEEEILKKSLPASWIPFWP